MGAAQVAPKPAFSTYATTAILGSSFGAKHINTEWSLPCGFWAVPVLPHITMPGMATDLAVAPGPPCTAISIPLTTSGK